MTPLYCLVQLYDAAPSIVLCQVGRLKKKEKEDAELERMKKALDKSTSEQQERRLLDGLYLC